MNIVQNRQSGFSLALVGVVIILVGLVGFVGWQAWSNSQGSQSDRPSSGDQTNITKGYKRYDDSKNRFSFMYPNDWEMANPKQNGAIVAFIRPSLKERINKAVDQTGGSTYDGPSFSLVVSYWNNVNKVVEDENYVDKRNYSHLSDFVNDQHVPIKKIGEIMVGNIKGYEIINPGISGQYALLLERADGVYQIEFSDVTRKEELSDKDKKIIESFKFD